jgi:hypothetical protein
MNSVGLGGLSRPTGLFVRIATELKGKGPPRGCAPAFQVSSLREKHSAGVPSPPKDSPRIG